MKPRIVFLDHTASLSGGELALVRLIRAAKDRIDPHVVLAEDGPLAQRLRDDGIATEILALAPGTLNFRKARLLPGRPPAQAALTTSAYAARLARRLAELRPQLVHSNSLKSGVYGSLATRLARVPLVWHLRDRLDDDYLPPAGQRLIRLLTRYGAELVLCNSESTRQTLHNGARALVIPSIVESPAPPLRRPAGDGVLRVGLVGRIARWKGQDLFLRAFAAAFPTGPTRAVIVGAPLFGPDERAFAEELRSQAAGLGIAERVEFRGHRDDIQSELAHLDILVHASTVPEPFGQAVVEGMAAGLPVIAADGGGPGELISDGRDGLLYPIGSLPALAAAMRRLADDPDLRARLGAAARETARAFAPERVVAQLMEAYQLVI